MLSTKFSGGYINFTDNPQYPIVSLYEAYDYLSKLDNFSDILTNSLYRLYDKSNFQSTCSNQGVLNSFKKIIASYALPDLDQCDIYYSKLEESNAARFDIHELTNLFTSNAIKINPNNINLLFIFVLIFYSFF